MPMIIRDGPHSLKKRYEKFVAKRDIDADSKILRPAGSEAYKIRDTIRTRGKLSSPQQWIDGFDEKAYEHLLDLQFENSTGGTAHFSDPMRIIRTHKTRRSWGTDPYAFPETQTVKPAKWPHSYSARFYQILDHLWNSALNYECHGAGFWHDRIFAYPKGFEDNVWIDDDKPIFLYEIFRVVVGLDDPSEMGKKQIILAPMLTAMGQAGIGPKLPRTTGDTNLGLGIDQTKIRQYRSNHGEVPWFSRTVSGIHKHDRSNASHIFNNAPWASPAPLLRINSSLVKLPIREKFSHPKSKDQTCPKTGDYVVMVGGTPEDGTDAGVGLPGLYSIADSQGIHDLVQSGIQSNYQFLHVGMKSAVFGPEKIVCNAKNERYRKCSQRALDILPDKSQSAKPAFEPMTSEEYLAYMSAFAKAEVTQQFERVPEDADGRPIKFVPTWKDNRTRLTVAKTTGVPFFSDVLRCEVCNGKVLVKLPKDPPFDAVDCPHCDSSGTVKTVHLRPDNPGELQRLRSNQ